MLTVLLPGNRSTLLSEAPDPNPTAGEVVIRMKAAGICELDLSTYCSPQHEPRLSGRPRSAGHECSGVVVEVGKGAARVAVGDRVLIHPYLGCGRCGRCAAGFPHLCIAGYRMYGMTEDGGLADYLRVKEGMCIPIPDDMSHEVGALVSCSMGTAYMALTRLPVSGSDTLLIYGLGQVGMSAILLAQVIGARIIAVDSDASRRQLATQMGVQDVLDCSQGGLKEQIAELTQGDGVDAAIDSVGNPQAWQAGLDALAICGRMCIVSESQTAGSVVNNEVLRKQLSITGCRAPSVPAIHELIALLIARSIRLERLIAKRFTLLSASRAFKMLERGTAGKIVFTWE